VFVQLATLEKIAVGKSALVTEHVGLCSRKAFVKTRKAFATAIQDGVGSNACFAFVREKMLPAQDMEFV
jgi:hypothetical protein